MNMTNYRILVAEDEYLLSEDLADALREVGADVVGPVGAICSAKQLIHGERIDGAVLDIELRDGLVSEVVGLLRGRQIPYVIVSGYDPENFAELAPPSAFFEKPARTEEVLNQLAILIQKHGNDRAALDEAAARLRSN